MERPRIPVLCLSDGHAGNVRQAEALALALGFVDAPHLTLTPSWLARRLAPRRFPGAARTLGSDFEHLLAAPPRLAIGCGRQAALATRLLRTRGSRVIQILDPRIDPAHFDRVVVPAHDRLRGPNVLTLDGSLHAVDADWLHRARHDFAELEHARTPRVALLVGGRSRHWAMDDAGFVASLAAVQRAVAEAGGHLQATASRRTPAHWRDALRDVPDALTWCDDRDGRNPYPGLLAWAEVIICSPDSVNMLSEACATSAPVYVIDGARLQGRPRVYLETLKSRGRVREFTGHLQAFKVTPLRETARIAAQLREWLDAPG